MDKRFATDREFDFKFLPFLLMSFSDYNRAFGESIKSDIEHHFRLMSGEVTLVPVISCYFNPNTYWLIECPKIVINYAIFLGNVTPCNLGLTVRMNVTEYLLV